MTQGREISLKTNGLWQGESYESANVPTTGRFRKLNGCIISKDGTELVRFPGMALVARPGYAEGGYLGDLTDISSATRADISSGSGPYGQYFLLPAANTHILYVDNVEETNDLPDGWYLCDTSTSQTTDANVDSTGSNSTQVDKFWIFRAGRSGAYLPIHDIIECLGVPVIVFETNVFYDATKAALPADASPYTQQKSLGAVVGHRAFDFSSVMTVEDFTFWPSSPHANVKDDIYWARDTDNSYETRGEQYDLRAIQRKMQITVFDGRVVIAAPGYGCCFEVNLKDHILENYTATSTPLQTAGRLDCLGIPRAALVGTREVALTFTPSGGGEVPNSGTMYVAAAYMNSKTGELGLLSRIHEETAPSSTGPFQVSVDVVHPRLIMRETEADTILVFSSASASGSGAALSLVAILDASGTLPTAVTFTATWAHSSTVLPVEAKRTPPPRIPQLPMGALFCRTMKGQLFTGGRFVPDSNAPDLSIESVLAHEDEASGEIPPLIKIQDPVLLAGKGMSPAYMGVQFRSTGNKVKKTALVEFEGVDSALPHEQRWTFTGATGAAGDTTVPILMPKGHVQYSPKDRPGEAPATNRAIFDRIEGLDVISCGRFGDYLVFCTDKETYVYAWGRSPLGTDPVLVDSEYGSISPVMVETDMGVTWLSHRGPVVFRGGKVEWIGRPVSGRFFDNIYNPSDQVEQQSFKRDSKGMMFHARAVHDRKRRLVLWFLRADHYETTFADAADDNDKSRVGNDEVLVWNYEINSWTTYRNNSFSWVGASQCVFNDGAKRPCLVTDRPRTIGSNYDVGMPGDVFGMEDRYYDRTAEPLRFTSAGAPTGVGATRDFQRDSGDFRDDLRYHPSTLKAEYQGLIRSPTANSDGSYTLKWWGVCNEIVSGSNDKVELGAFNSRQSPVTKTWSWAAGDILELGLIHMEIETTLVHNYIEKHELKREERIGGVVLEHSFYKVENTGGSPRCAWLFIEVWDERTQTWTSHANTWGTWLNVDKSVTRVQIGDMQGVETAVRLVVVSNCEAHIKDIRLEMGVG